MTPEGFEATSGASPQMAVQRILCLLYLAPVLAEKGIRSKIRDNIASITWQRETKDTMDATPETNRSERDTQTTVH